MAMPDNRRAASNVRCMRVIVLEVEWSSIGTRLLQKPAELSFFTQRLFILSEAKDLLFAADSRSLAQDDSPNLGREFTGRGTRSPPWPQSEISAHTRTPW